MFFFFKSFVYPELTTKGERLFSMSVQHLDYIEMRWIVEIVKMMFQYPWNFLMSNISKHSEKGLGGSWESQFKKCMYNKWPDMTQNQKSQPTQSCCSIRRNLVTKFLI